MNGCTHGTLVGGEAPVTGNTGGARSLLESANRAERAAFAEDLGQIVEPAAGSGSLRGAEAVREP